MSRALEKHVIEALKKGDPQRAFEEISLIFSPTNGVASHDLLWEVEFLGQSHPLGPEEYILRDGNAVAIPKLRLVQAFAVARQHLAKWIQKHQPGGGQGNAMADDMSTGELDVIRRATSVLLLMDPEHLTAANTRKRVLLHAVTATAAEADTPQLARKPLFEAERHFVDSLLTSPLHRHSKSPTLWSHRRWLFGQHRRCGVDSVDVVGDMRAVVFKSAERHQRNYYAWCHARWLMAAFITKNVDDDDDDNNNDDDDDDGGRHHIVHEIISDVKTWCLKHHTDISGWSFLLHLLQGQNGRRRRDVCDCVFRETITLSESFQWSNDSVWWFLHAMVSNSMVSRGEISVFETIAGDLYNRSGRMPPDKHGLLAEKWYHQTFSQHDHGK